jgi:aryl-phospho-beta-D-glucosidase BglC (GH1 family)
MRKYVHCCEMVNVMRKTVFIIYVVQIFIFQNIFAQGNETVKTHKIKKWWQENHYHIPKANPDAKKLPLISVKGNKFVSSQGDTILFRGMAISDPDKLEAQKHWDKSLFSKIKELGAGIVRIPIHPAAWRDRTPEKYLALLDQAVAWCTELGMYIIIDWHSIGNLHTELFQDPMYNTTKTETFEFWRAIARQFAGNNTVAFYEIFNEPTTISNRLGRMSWDEWKKINEDIIVMIRAYDKETIPLVAPLDWAYDLTPLRISPIQAEGIAYVTHPYANKRMKPWEDKWEEDFGFASQKYPVVASEFGFMPVTKEMIAKYGDYSDYGERIIKFLEGRGISWVVWIFDPEWFPPLITSWDYKLSESGEFFSKAMQDTTWRQK